MTDAGWFPLIEENQGFLSLLALIAALCVAYVEWRLLIHRDRASFRNDVRAAGDVVDRVLKAIDTAGDRPGTRAKGDVGGTAKDCADALKAIAGSRIHTAAFTVAVIDAANHLKHFSGVAGQLDGDRPYDCSWKPAIAGKRDAILVACLRLRAGQRKAEPACYGRR